MVAAFTDHVTLIQEPDEGACAVGLVLHSSMEASKGGGWPQVGTGRSDP